MPASIASAILPVTRFSHCAAHGLIGNIAGPQNHFPSAFYWRLCPKPIGRSFSTRTRSPSETSTPPSKRDRTPTSFLPPIGLQRRFFRSRPRSGGIIAVILHARRQLKVGPSLRMARSLCQIMSADADCGCIQRSKISRSPYGRIFWRRCQSTYRLEHRTLEY